MSNRAQVVLTLTLLAVLLAASAACHAADTSGPEDWKAWRMKRDVSIGGTNGWTTLVGLHWLPEGDSTAGTDPTNKVVLDTKQMPPTLGVFTRKGTVVTFAVANGAEVRIAGRRITKSVVMATDAMGQQPTRLQIGSASIIAIQRGLRTGLRVRDPESEHRRQFKGLKCLPYDVAWRLDGRFVPFPEARTLIVADVTGGKQDYRSPGSVVFTAKNVEYRLDVVEEPDEADFFVLFKDATSGVTTYGSGRFLYVARPGADGRKVVIDFNRAYTPPCGFTDFATCPLPPPQNTLPFEVNAGELGPGGKHH